MNTEHELRKWLNRPNQTIVENLDFGIKVWNSIEFVLLTKQEIIFDEFCNNLPRLRDENAQKATDSTYESEAWQKINELLSLHYSAGTVSIAVKDKLVKALSEEAKFTIKQSKCSAHILKALLTTLENTSMQNYYKSNIDEFTRFVGTIIAYMNVLIQENSNALPKIVDDNIKSNIEKITATIRGFIKQTPFLEAFKTAFAQNILEVFSELSIESSQQDSNYRKEFLGIIQELYFDGCHVNQLKQLFSGNLTKQDNAVVEEFRTLFKKPMHVILSICEVIILSFRNDTEIQQSFLQYLFESENGKFANDCSSVQEQLEAITIFVLLLKKHDVPLNFDIGSIKAFAYLGKHIEHIVNIHYNNHSYDVLSLLCAAIRLNPLILEYSACQIGVKFMLAAKGDDNVWRKYEEFMYLLIEMYRKWNRGEKFISQLVKNIQETLAIMKLSKKLKRSFIESHMDSPVALKKRRSTNGEISIENDESFQQASPDKSYLGKLEQIITQNCENISSRLPLTQRNNCNETWTNIAFAFTPAISDSYIRFISGLVSKPSLIVWKTLLFALKEYIQQLTETEKNSENSIFIIEITSALLSQYFVGSRLIEQLDKSSKSIEANCTATKEVLHDFGHAILNQEHCSRTMNAFLKLCYCVSNFDLLCWYYQPDSMEASDKENDAAEFPQKSPQNIFDYLSEKEWTLIEQRINNFGKSECHINMNKIHLQRLKAIQLVGATDQAVNTEKHILPSLFNYPEQVISILNDSTLNVWFLENLNDEQKQNVCELLLQSSDGIETLNSLNDTNSRRFIEILVLSIYKKIFVVLSTGKHSEHLSEIDFAKIFKGESDVGKIIGSFIKRQEQRSEKIADKKHVQKHVEEIRGFLQLIRGLPIGYCAGKMKEIFSLLNIAVFQYLKAAGSEELKEITIYILKALLHFNELPAIFQNLSLNVFVTLFQNEPAANPVLSILFERLCRDLNADTLKTLDDLFVLLTKFYDEDLDKRNILLEIGVMIMVGLSKDKKQKCQLERFRDCIADIIRKEIANNNESLDELIAMTLPAFVIIVKSHIFNSKSTETDTVVEGNKDITELIRTFLKYTADCKNADSVKLLNATLENRAHLNLTEAEIKLLIGSYWQNFKEVCSTEHEETVNKTVNSAIKLIFDHKSTDEWIELLNQMERDIEAAIFSSHAKQQSRILLSMAKCQYNKAKGQIFIGFFKNVTRQINMTIRTKTIETEQNFNWILNILECYSTVLSNSQLPVSVELIDDILSFLTEINIKKINASTFDSKNFVELLKEMCAVCLHLIMHRNVFIMSRVPQFVNVYKDLLQTVCWYKSNRSQHTQLEQAEVTVLAEQAHNLEKINKYFVKHSVEVKRVAPYLLLFVINLMVSNDRPTTLYSKIKTHIEYICYDLISVCDHRVEGFILRSCNEASKAVYETLHRDYEKYFKFKGKV